MSEDGKKGLRSPNAPSISLEEAVGLAQKIYNAERAGWARVLVAVTKHWGYGEKSSAWKIRLAALRAYGLIEFRGQGEAKELRISDSCRIILLDRVPGSAKRAAALREAALLPKVFREIRDKWGSELGSDPTVESYLVLDRGFLESGAKSTLANYKATIEFAGLNDPAGVDEPAEEEEEDDDDEDPPAERTRRRRNDPMKRRSSSADLREYPITLPSLNVATIAVPRPLSESDYRFLTQTLEAMREALLRPATVSITPAEPDDLDLDEEPDQ